MVTSIISMGIWFLSAFQLGLVFAYPTGAPSEACEGMIPTGHYSTAQTSASVYEIKLSSATYCPKKDVTITLMGKSNEMLKGFLCQARTAVNTYETSGSLTSGDSNMVTKNDCSGKASITHSERSDKASVVLKWTPNEGLTSEVFIVCTIVKEKTMFWVKQNVQITYAGADNCTADEKGLGDDCSSNDDCKGIPMAVCNNVCECPVTYKEQGNQMSKSCVARMLNDSCTTNAQCGGLNNANCTGGMCKLDDMGVCKSDTDCSGMDGKRCVDGKCTSGGVRTVMVSFLLILGSLVFTLF